MRNNATIEMITSKSKWKMRILVRVLYMFGDRTLNHVVGINQSVRDVLPVQNILLWISNNYVPLEKM